MIFILIQTLNSLVYGLLLFFLSAGLSLIFGLMNVVNMTHGSFFAIGAFTAFSVSSLTGNFWLGLLAAPFPAFVLGFALERYFVSRLYRRGHLDQVLLTFGFIFIFVDLMKAIWGNDIKQPLPPSILQGSIGILGEPFPTYRIFVLVVGILLAACLWLFVERSKIGAKIRAGADDSAMASGLGINTKLLFSSMFAFGSSLAAFGGAIAAPILGAYRGLDVEILIPAFIVVVIGGMGSLRGAFFASLFLGFADTFGKAYVPDFALFLIYVVMAVTILAKPEGLFGRGEHAI